MNTGGSTTCSHRRMCIQTSTNTVTAGLSTMVLTVSHTKPTGNMWGERKSTVCVWGGGGLFFFFMKFKKKTFQVKIGDMIFMLGTVNKVKDRISETILNDKFKISQRIICSLIFLKFILLPISWGFNNHIQILRPLYLWEDSYIYLLYLGEGDDRRWDGWMASPIRWTWVWTSSRSWWRTGKPGVLQSMGSQKAGHNWATELTNIYESNFF